MPRRSSSSPSGLAGTVLSRRSALASLLLLASGGPAGAFQDPDPESGNPLTAAQEEHLLLDVCDYLKLTPTQVSRLLPLARQAERYRKQSRPSSLEQRRLNGLATRSPADGDRFREELDHRAAQAEGEAAKFGAQQLVRILNREQIALAWRLSQGNPPKYAAADPALLRPDAGFSGSRSPLAELDLVSLRGAVQLQGQALEARRAFGGEAGDTDGQEQLRVRERYLQRLMQLEDRGAAAELELQAARMLRLQGDADAASAKPFPQLVIESENLEELVPGVAPLARRLFLSDRWAAALKTRLARGDKPPSVPYSATLMGPLKLVREYRTDRGLGDQASHGPELLPLGGAMQNGLYVFGPGQGLAAMDLGVTDQYVLQLTFRAFSGDASYQKLVDFKLGKEDLGLYLYQGHVTFYTLADGGAPVPGQEHRLRIERNRTTRIVRGYLDMRPIFAFIDLDDSAAFEDGQGLLFVDDKQTSGEQGPGAFRSLSVWRSAGDN